MPTSDKTGTIHGRLTWYMHKDATHKSKPNVLPSHKSEHDSSLFTWSENLTDMRKE